MKIYITGAHSQGKTTLARYISKKYNIPMITEAARAILSEKELQIDNLRHDLDVVDDYQKSIFERQIIEEGKLESFVSDRSFDFLAYAAQYTRILPDLLNSDILKKYIESLKNKDCILFFVRPSKATMKEDGVREALSWDGVVSIDSQLKFMMEMWQLRYFQINFDNMQERVRFVDSILSLK